MEESRTNWIPINSQLREEIVFKLALTDLNLQDDRLHFGEFDSKSTRAFKWKEHTKRPYEFDNSIHLSITFEMELDLQVIDSLNLNYKQT